MMFVFLKEALPLTEFMGWLSRGKDPHLQVGGRAQADEV